MSQFFASGGQSIGASASASILPMNISGLISFRMDWLDLLAVQGSLPQNHSSTASTLWHSAFFIVQLSHPYTTTGKPIALLDRLIPGGIDMGIVKSWVVKSSPSESEKFSNLAAVTLKIFCKLSLPLYLCVKMGPY